MSDHPNTGPELWLPGREDVERDADREQGLLLPGDAGSSRPVELSRNPDGTWTARMFCLTYTSDSAADCWDWLRRKDGPGAVPLLA